MLVVPDRMGAMPADVAGTAVAEGWRAAAGETEVAVVPCGDAGAGFADAVAALWRVEPTLASDDPDQLATWVVADERAVVAVEPRPDLTGFRPEASSAPLGRAVRALLSQHRPRRLVIDLAGTTGHDGGAGMLAELGATADVSLTDGVTALGGLGHIDIAPVRQLLDGIELVGVVPVAEASDQLLGLRGITSRRGTELGMDPAVMLSTDAALERLARLVDPESAAIAGAGAAGGLAWAILALGGRVVPAVDLIGELASIPDTARLADVVVTTSTAFDFHHKGGGVVDRAAGWAADALRPCVVLAGEVMISDREMRLMGIEAAYPVSIADPDRLRDAVTRVAGSWTWS
ncbi:glycerate kinase [Enemella sp. A6]|uniref:glycerate kinase n=1 Tax=Enemella sp. A6 TaxID=3440152 RepID=UPI003EBA6CBF